MCIWSKGLVSCWAIISLKVQKVSIGTNFYPSTNYVPLDLCTLSMHRYRGNHITWPNRNEHIRLESWLVFNQCNSFVCMGYNSVCWIHDILCMHFQNLIITLIFMHACVIKHHHKSGTIWLHTIIPYVCIYVYSSEKKTTFLYGYSKVTVTTPQ